MRKREKIFPRKACILVAALLIFTTFAWAVPQNSYLCAVYFTGIGCPHCAKTDPVVLGKLPQQHKNLIIIEYEIYQLRENAPLLEPYNNAYGAGLGVPLIIFNKNKYIIGDSPILSGVETALNNLKTNPCPLMNGNMRPFMQLDIVSLPGKPKIWANNRILIKDSPGGDNNVLKKLLTADDITSALKDLNYVVINPEPAPLSGREVKFKHAIQLNGWIFEWNEERTIVPSSPSPTNSPVITKTPAPTPVPSSPVNTSAVTKVTKMLNGSNSAIEPKVVFTLPKIVGLAAVDAINPCALAVLTLMLIAILTYNPKSKRNVLLAGLAFTLAVFIIYLIYGLFIIKFFQLVQVLTNVKLWLYKFLGLVAILLGLLNVKDFIRYRPGGFLTEMPLSWRPKAKKLISSITSPKGAFILGTFVTVFLLPCTIGPYVIAGGILSAFDLFRVLPLLLLYNAIFVLPMIAITLIVYAGIAQIEDVSDWKSRNIRYVHLSSGVIMALIGIGIAFGLI